jgi:Cu/Ag efflux protein CusF
LDKGQAVGPELSQMGPMHPLEYFTESTINPSAVGAKKYRGPDGKSKMPDFNSDMTVQELIDVSAYLASLKPKGVAKSVTAEGKVIAVVPESQEIIIEHGDIKGFMDAMTMGFKANPTSLLKTVKPGDKVRFTIDTNKRSITKIEKLKN